MAYFKFTKYILENKPIDLYGDNYRDMTFIDDVVSILSKILDDYETGNIIKVFKSENNPTVINIGAGARVKTSNLINIIGKINKKRH